MIHASTWNVSLVLLLRSLILVCHVGVLVFPCPKWCWVLLNELVDVLILTIDNHALKWVLFPEFHFEEINKTCGLTDFKATRLIIMHSVPLSLASNCQIFSTIDIDDLTSYFVTMLRCQVNNCVTNFLNSTCSSHGIVVFFFLHHWVIFQFCQTCLSVEISSEEWTWNAVNSDTESSKFYCCRFS